MRENPKPFEVYRHFKGNLYQILTLAEHSEDGRTMVVYQALYGAYKVYVRSLDMFMSLTDTEKYPDVTQRYRFEKIETKTEDTPLPAAQPADPPADTPSYANVHTDHAEDVPDLDPAVLEFLDAETYQQKLNILASMKHRITDEMINTLAIASDLEVEPGPVEKRYDSLKNCLLMKDRFEKVRLF
ncbi:MAG: DUF1653 domain-containing protein [Lachnospiraceae bacterium]|nr:DUF1653 domain-containing protein [Lachnospiraceae bacterium]